MTPSVWFLFTLVFWFAQGLSPRTTSLCFFGGQLVIDGVDETTKCILGKLEVLASVQGQSYVCDYPALRERSYPVSISGSQKYDLGEFEVESCSQVFYTPSCPSAKPNVTVVLGHSIAASNLYMCVWNGVGGEVLTPQGLTITCPIPYNKNVAVWNLTLKTSDHGGSIGESPVLVSFQNTDCQDQTPHIVSVPSSITPWSQEINLSTSSHKGRETRTDGPVLCRYSSSGNNHDEIGASVSDGSVRCPSPILPVGKSTLEISTDGVTFSQPAQIWIESGVTDYFPKTVCTHGSDLKLSIRSREKFSSNISYDCYFGSVGSSAQIADDYTLICSIPYGASLVEISLLVHNRDVNRAAAFVVGSFFYDESC